MYWCIAAIVDLVKILLICVGIFKIPVKKTRIKYITILYMVVVIGLLVADYISGAGDLYANISVFVMFAAAFVVLERKKYVALLAYVAEQFAELLLLVFYSYLKKMPLQTVMENEVLEFGTSILVIVLLAIVVFLIGRKNAGKKGRLGLVDRMNVKAVIMLVISSFGICLNILSVHLVITSKHMGDTFHKRSLILTTIGTLSFVVLIIWFFVKDYLVQWYREKADMTSRILEEQQKYCELLVEKSEETRKLRHDMNNHLVCMNHLIQSLRYEELEVYMRKLGQKVNDLKLENETGNNLINVMIHDLKGKYNQIIFKAEGEFPEEITISLIDLSTIFYNLLNNAFEAAELSEYKEVVLSAKMSGSHLYVTILNSVLHKVEIRNNVIQTTKKDKLNHGYGIDNAKRCIESIGGNLTLSCDDKEFKAEVVLLNVCKAKK